MQERSRSPDVALSRAPGGGAEAAGLAVVPDALRRHRAAQVRCPKCDKLLAEQLQGSLTVTCSRCKHRETFTR
jgi:DNA-directed RNA polymerase subunit RPC12/RpoP